MENIEYQSALFTAKTFTKKELRPLDVEIVDSFAFKAGKNIDLGIETADEVPLVFAAEGMLGVAKVTLDDAVKEVIKDRLHAAFTQFNVDPAKLEVYMGPCLTFSHTHVERPLIEELMDRGYRACCKRTDGVDFLDVPVLLLVQLRHLGVKMENIHISDYDTFENPDILFSRLRGDSEGNFTLAHLD